MATKTITGKVSDASQEVAKGVESGIALGLLKTIENKILSAVPPAARDGIKLFGLENMTYRYFHLMTPVEEEAVAQAEAAQARVARLQALIPDAGGMTAEQADALRAALRE